MTDRPWLSSYDPGVPASLAPYPDKTLLDVAADAAREVPDHTALIFKGSRLSHGRLEQLSDAFAAALLASGVRRGDRVALLLPNCPQFVLAELGAWKAGAIVVPLNPIYNEAELRLPLVDTGAETVVVLTPFYERLKSIQRETPIRRVIATNVKEHLPWHLRLLFTLFKEKKEGHRIGLRDGDVWLPDFLRLGGGRPPSGERPQPDDVALILMSGGTTGVPKGVVCPHRGLLATALQAHAWIKPVLADGKDVVMLPLPLFHAAAAVLGLGTFLVGRNPLVLVPNPRDISDLLATIRRERPAFFAGVPTLFAALLDHPDVASGNADFRSIKLCFCGAAPLMAETRRRFESLTGGRIVEVYSLTEALVAPIIGRVVGPNRPGAAGLPAPDVDLRIADPDSGGALPAGQVGEILIRAPQVMPGYWNNPEETALALREHDGQRWLHTGDLGYLDGDGFLFIVDRLKDLIKPGGLQVWPREVEEAIASHPAVSETGVAGIPHEAKGEAVKAWVVLRAGACLTAEELRTYCKQRLAPFKVPSEVEFRGELPKSMVGKVLRRALVEEHRARLQ